MNTDARYWVLLLARAVPAAVLALAITFSSDHSTTLGYIALGAFSVVAGAVLVAGNARLLDAGLYRTLFIAQGAVTILGGIVALVAVQAGLPFLLFLTTALFGVTGILELVAGLRARGRVAVARDWVFVGAFSAAFALAVLLIPVNYVEVITIPDKEVPPLTAAIILVGAIGAWAAIVAVYLVIAALSLKWAKPAATAEASA